MFKTIMLGVLGLAAAAGVPYLVASGPSHFTKLRQWIASSPAPDQPAAEIALGQPPAGPELLGGSPTPPPLEGMPAARLEEVFRFDVTPAWITQRWPRVSNGLADLQLQGYRVPLVTGTTEMDLAGSLTYYFNAQHQVQRIAFTGSTGNVGPLVNLLGARFRMARRPTNDPTLMIYESVTADGKPSSTARIRTAPVIRAGDTFRRYDVQLVLERPEKM